MRILILGGSGMIGHRLWLAFRERFETFVALRGSPAERPWATLFAGVGVLEAVDLTDDAALGRTLLRVRPDVVVNAAGLVKQRPLGQDLPAAITLNALLPHRLAAFCIAGGIRLVHLSSDCVFSGRVGHYREADAADPVDVYGRAKLLGEVSGPGQLTIRKSVIGRELTGRQGLLEWFLANRGGRVRGYRRAVFSGLTTLALADTIARIIEEQPALEGVWHVAAPAIAKYDLLVSLRDGFSLPIEIEPEETTIVDRSLDDTRFRQATGLPRPSWDRMISALVADPLPYDVLRGERC
jgi:dTDP-4-dehydrorhamnose reductase